MTLLYLAGTVCSDLGTELVLRINKLSCQTQSYLVGHIYSASLHSKLIDNLPKVKQMHDLYRSMFDSDTGLFTEEVRSVLLVSSHNPEPSHGSCNSVSRNLEPSRGSCKSSTDSISTHRTKINLSATVHAKAKNSVRSNSVDSRDPTKINPSATVPLRSNSVDLSCSRDPTKINPSATLRAKVENSVRSNGADFPSKAGDSRRGNGDISCKPRSIDKPCLKHTVKENPVRPRGASLDMSFGRALQSGVSLYSSRKSVNTNKTCHDVGASSGAKGRHKSDTSCKPPTHCKTAVGPKLPDPAPHPGSPTHSCNKSTDRCSTLQVLAKSELAKTHSSSSSKLKQQSLLVHPNPLAGKKPPPSTRIPLHQAHPHKKNKHSLAASNHTNNDTSTSFRKNQCSIPKGKGKLTTPNNIASSSSAPLLHRNQNQPPPTKRSKYSSRLPSGQAQEQGLGNARKLLPQLTHGPISTNLPIGTNLPEHSHSTVTVSINKKAVGGVLVKVNGFKVGI